MYACQSHAKLPGDPNSTSRDEGEGRNSEFCLLSPDFCF